MVNPSLMTRLEEDHGIVLATNSDETKDREVEYERIAHTQDGSQVIKWLLEDPFQAHSQMVNEFAFSQLFDHPHLLRADKVIVYANVGRSMDRPADTVQGCMLMPRYRPIHRPENSQNKAIDSVDELKKLVTHMADALHFLHRHHIIHRDVKTSNILYDAQKDAYILMDFELMMYELGQSKSVNVYTVGFRDPVLACSRWHGYRDAIYGTELDMYALGQVIHHIIYGFPQMWREPWTSQFVRYGIPKGARLPKSMQQTLKQMKVVEWEPILPGLTSSDKVFWDDVIRKCCTYKKHRLTADKLLTLLQAKPSPGRLVAPEWTPKLWSKSQNARFAAAYDCGKNGYATPPALKEQTVALSLCERYEDTLGQLAAYQAGRKRRTLLDLGALYRAASTLMQSFLFEYDEKTVRLDDSDDESVLEKEDHIEFLMLELIDCRFPPLDLTGFKRSSSWAVVYPTKPLSVEEVDEVLSSANLSISRK